VLFREPGSPEIRAEHSANFSSFYPSTHLDFSGQIEALVRRGMAHPCKLFLNPTTCATTAVRSAPSIPPATKKGLYSIPWPIIEESVGAIRELSPQLTINISGGGEPSLAPGLKPLLRLLLENRVPAFLTTNGSRDDTELWELAVQACAVLVVSIRGLCPENYRVVDAPRRADRALTRYWSGSAGWSAGGPPLAAKTS